MHNNKILTSLLVFSLSTTASLALPPERTCNGTTRDQVNACINGGPDGTQTWTKAADGTIIHLKATPSSTWDTPIVVDNNVQIHGAGVGVGGTHINAGKLFQLKPHGGTLQPRMIVSDMHINKDRAAVPTFDITGVCPINDAHISDPTQSGGFEVHNIVITATNNPAGQGGLFYLGGWPEGCVHHNVVDLDVMPHPDPNKPPAGEWIIINFNGTPTSKTGSGFWAWTHDPPIDSHHLVTFEDNIFHRHGAVDSNQWAVGSAGGAMYRARHNTLWHGTSGHGGPSDSHVWGIRFEDSHKNLFVRGIEEGVDEQSKNMVDVRGGEAVAWGNRMNRYGVNSQVAAAAFQIECNVISSGLSDDMTGGPDGTNPWFENQKGPFSIGSFNYAPEVGYLRTYTNEWIGDSKVVDGVDKKADNSASLAGDVYLSGKGGTMTSVHNFTLKKNNVVLSNQPAHKWENFMVVNLSKIAGLATGPGNPFGNPGQPTPTPGTTPIPSTQTYAYVISHAEVNGQTVFTKLTTNMFDSHPTEWAIDADDLWEIRRVRKFLNAAGHGSGDSLVDENTAGNPNFRNALRLVSGTPNPRWTNEPTDFGVHKWDNKYRLSAIGSWLDVSGWASLDVTCQYACGGNVGEGSTVPTTHDPPYIYNSATAKGAATGGTQGASGTELRAATRVGADTVAWALVPANGFIAHQDDGCGSNTTPCEGVDSFYELGTGGPTYPHPFVVASVPVPAVKASGPTFTIGGTDDCAVPSNCVHITTSGFTTSPIVITIDTPWSPALSNVSLSSTSGTGLGTIHGTASGNSAGAYATTVHADTATEHAQVDLSITLQSGNQAPFNVALTSPTAGQIFAPTDTVDLVSTASDDVGVTKVEFYDGATCLNCPDGDTTTPYSYSGTFSVTGAHSLTAKAYDGSLTTTSAARSITISNPLATPTPPGPVQLKP